VPLFWYLLFEYGAEAALVAVEKGALGLGLMCFRGSSKACSILYAKHSVCFVHSSRKLCLIARKKAPTR
jgi:hypothetical protein